MKNKILILVAVLFSFNASAQKDVTLTITHKLGSGPFALNQSATNNLSHNFDVSRVDYYLSKFTIIHDGSMQTVVPASKYILVKEGNNLVANLGNFNVANVEGIKFHIGVDSPTNNSDPSQYSIGDPLGPMFPPMHWSWTDGYRFVAIDGKGGNSLSASYSIHGLFNANYFEQTVMATGVNSGSEVFINLDADIAKALNNIDVSVNISDHGNNLTDLTVLQNFRDHVFSPGTGIPTGVSKTEQKVSMIAFPNPSSGLVSFSVNNINASDVKADIYDVIGRRVKEISFDNRKEIDVQFNTKGIYFVKLKSNGQEFATKTIVIQ